jgi:nicotinamidase-related amidase
MSAPETARRPRIGWVVDVQNDFMQPAGRLYVHDLFDATDEGAVLATGAIVDAVGWMRAHCEVVVFTGDWHAYGDREIDTMAPDATRGTYPPHCMGLSPNAEERAGAALIDAIAPGDDVLVLARDASADEGRELARRAVRERRPVFIQKSEFSVFTGNPATEPFLGALVESLGGEAELVVCGVATDVCVKHAVDGMLDRNRTVRLVTDAMWGLGLERPSELFDQWARRGATLTTTVDLSSAAGQRGASRDR